MPNGPHNDKTVVNGNTTTDAMTTQKYYIGNGPAAASDVPTPSFPVLKKDRLGYAQ